MTSAAGQAERLLLCRVGGCTCGIPIGFVVETMRPMPVDPVAGAPELVTGLAIIRGSPVPVVDVAKLVGCGPARAEGARFVTVKAGARVVALSVDEVIGVRSIDAGSLAGLPPLLAGSGASVIGSIGRLDAELLIVLEAARVVENAAP